ncbi:hypothetical protein HED60_09940 [Planctomycetales bacterium ZRK34]|nr:hypothetical protein HED60_09940 [Planctomycetales bacterium ZRK34]
MMCCAWLMRCWITCVCCVAMLAAGAEAASIAPRVDAKARTLAMVDQAGAAWLIDGFARVVLSDEVSFRSDDARYQLTQRGGAGDQSVELAFRDTKGELDLHWTITPLDERSATVRLTIHNRSAKPMRLKRLEVLCGKLADRHESPRLGVLLNGFVLSPPHATLRAADTTSLSSNETIAIESPPLAAGWLTGEHNFGHIDLQHLNNQPALTAWGQGDDCVLPAGASRTSDLLFVSTHPSPLSEMERFADLAGRINHARIWPPRIAWCSWYAGWMRKTMATYKDGLEKGVEQNIASINKYFASRGARTMRICDDFIDYGDWSNNTKTIPGGFDRLAKKIDQAGLTPGVWYAPYWAEAESRVLKEHPDWFARNRKGDIWYETGWQPNSRDTTRFAVFDTTHPQVVDYFEQTARQWRQRGFRYVSTDFLNWSLQPDRFHDPTMTRAEMLRAGMAAIRRGLGPDVFYRPINNPLGVAMGIANDTRISGDSHGDNPTAYFRTAEVWFYNRRVWLNDPSAIVCARYGKLRPIQWNRLWMSWMALAGTVLTYGEVIDELPEPYIQMYQRIFPNLPVAGRPLDIWENKPYMLWGMNPGEADGAYTLFGVFDIKGKGPRHVRLNLDEIAARCQGWTHQPSQAPGRYLLWNFWEQKLVRSDQHQLELPLPAKSCYVFALRPDFGRPQLLGTSGHFSQGVIETRDLTWAADSKQITGQVMGNGGDPSTLFFHVPDGMQLADAQLGDADAAVRQLSDDVLAVDLPHLEKFTSLTLRFSGTAGSVDQRPFEPGRAAERFD